MVEAGGQAERASLGIADDAQRQHTANPAAALTTRPEKSITRVKRALAWVWHAPQSHCLASGNRPPVDWRHWLPHVQRAEKQPKCLSYACHASSRDARLGVVLPDCVAAQQRQSAGSDGDALVLRWRPNKSAAGSIQTRRCSRPAPVAARLAIGWSAGGVAIGAGVLHGWASSWAIMYHKRHCFGKCTVQMKLR